MKVTEHFSMEELTVSETAGRLGIDNSVPTALLPNIVKLASRMEMVRAILGKPIHVNSGFRCKKLNDAIPGSSKVSAHMSALAMDFICPAFGTPLDVCMALKDHKELHFDQLIFEHSWVHIGFKANDEDARGQLLTANNPGAGVSYKIGF